jgi:opacity protein-like surface antigen
MYHPRAVKMRERVKAIAFGAATMFAALPAMAQVGHDPAKSPYADLEYSQELTVLGGYLRTRHDPAGVAPLSRPMLGVRYEITLTGPLAMSAEVNAAPGKRNVIDPTKPVATRSLGTQSNLVMAADLALAMNLTGTRSWHRLVPQVRAGVGLINSRAKDDSSGFAFGTPFAFTFGGGVKYVPGGRFQLRADITDRVFKLNYPDPYYRTTSDNTAVLPVTTGRSFYTHHTAFTVGVSYLFAR